jgi:hypothetical protein
MQEWIQVQAARCGHVCRSETRRHRAQYEYVYIQFGSRILGRMLWHTGDEVT